jgi:hypothetical protein
MARIRKYKLTWEPAASDQVEGYKIYWSKGQSVGYDSNSIALGKVGEINLSEVLKDQPFLDGPIMFAIAAVDKNGNESDLATLAEPYRITVPPAPMGFSLKALEEFNAVDMNVDMNKEAVAHFDTMFEEHSQEDAAEDFPRKEKPLLGSAPTEARVKYYDDVGYRKLTLDK